MLSAYFSVFFSVCMYQYQTSTVWYLHTDCKFARLVTHWQQAALLAVFLWQTSENFFFEICLIRQLFLRVFSTCACITVRHWLAGILIGNLSVSYWSLCRASNPQYTCMNADWLLSSTKCHCFGGMIKFSIMKYEIKCTVWRINTDRQSTEISASFFSSASATFDELLLCIQ